MPTAPAKRCSRPFCPNYRPCPVHNVDRERPSPKERGYKSRRWASARLTMLRRDRWCRCEEYRAPGDTRWRCCPESCARLAHVADHHPRSRKQLVADGVLDPDDPMFLKGLAQSCHSRITNKLQPGGWNDR